MSRTEDILKKARELGQEVAKHPAAQAMSKAREAFEADRQVQRLLTDYNRLIQTLSQKQQRGEAIEVAEKRQLQELQESVASHPMVGQIQVAEMNYLDLMRRVHETVNQEAEGREGHGGITEQVAPGASDVVGRIQPPR